MTKAFGFAAFGCSHRGRSFTCFSKSWRRSDAVPLLQARAFELAVSIRAPPEQSSEENAWFRARIPAFRFRHSFVIRHSSFVICVSPRYAIPYTAIAWQIPSHVSPLQVKS